MQYAQSHIKTYRYPIQNSHRTTIKVEKEEWLAFKKEARTRGLTTCFLIRQFVHKWLLGAYSGKVLFDRARYTHWEYLKEPMMLVKVDKKGKIMAESL